ncbi:hypothetical protein AAFA46_05475 [Oscillospiraceae bacterium WX1]
MAEQLIGTGKIDMGEALLAGGIGAVTGGLLDYGLPALGSVAKSAAGKIGGVVKSSAGNVKNVVTDALDTFTGGAKAFLADNRGMVDLDVLFGGKSAGGTAIDSNILNGKPLYRAMSEPELNAVKETGYLRGGRDGSTYFTDSYYKSANNAQNRLSLPNKPEYIMEFKITNNPTVYGGNTVNPAFGGSGGGREYFSNNPVQVNIVNYQKMR